MTRIVSTFTLSLCAIYSQDLHDHFGREIRLMKQKKILNPTWFNGWIHWAAVWYRRRISLFLWKEAQIWKKKAKDTLAKKLVFERKRKEITRASRKRRMDERRSEKRAYLTIHPLSGGNARACWLTDSSCLLDIRAKPTPLVYMLYSISHPVGRSTTSSVNHRKGSTRL